MAYSAFTLAQNVGPPSTGGNFDVVSPMQFGAFADNLVTHTLTSQDVIDHGPGGTKTPWVGTIIRSVTDGVFSSTTITSATAMFTTADIGKPIRGTGIFPGSVVKTVTNPTTITIGKAVDPAVPQTGVTLKIGHYEVGDHWDGVALQEAIFAAFQSGTLTPNKNNAKLNKILYIPPGSYKIKKTPTMYEVVGGTVLGGGRLSTNISSLVSGEPAWACNGLWFTQFTGIQWLSFTGATTANDDDPLFTVDGNWDGIHTLGIQGNTWKDCHWDASFVRDPLFAMIRSGASAQGSENLWLNCHFNNPAITAFNNYNNYNALQHTFIGGNFTQHVTGVRIGAGSANLYSVGFQAKKPKQIDYNGWDFVQTNTANAHSSMSHCRSESYKTAFAGNGVVFTLDSCVLDSVATQGQWVPNHSYLQGHIVSGVNGGGGNGHLHRAIVGGTSGGAEPTWVDNDGAPALEDLTTSIVSGTNQLTGADSFNNAFGQMAGRGVMVVGAGVAGANLYTTCVSFDRPSNTLTLFDNASTTVTDTRTVCSPITTDNTVKWIQEEFLEAHFNAPATVRNCSFRWGQVRTTNTTWPTVIEHSNFARADWSLIASPYGTGNVANTPAFPMVLTADGKHQTENFLTLNGGFNDGVAAVRLPAPSRATAITTTTGTINIMTFSRIAYTLTPTGDCTINFVGPGLGGDRVTLLITTSGSTSRTITFGTNFVSTGPVVTGTVSGKVWTVTFISKDGTMMIETGRTGPL